jgi:glycosyltransferase involved in cell wall biosynthesis
LRILFVGSRILPFRHAGDKNFWLDMFHGLQRRGHELEIVSSTFEDVPSEGLPIRRVQPIPINLRPDPRMNPSHWFLAGTNNYVSKTVSLPRITRAVRRRRREFRPDVIHFIENYGPAMAGLRPAFPRIPLTISAPTYQPNRPMYDMLLEASFASFDTIVPFSEAYRRRLLELRFRPERVRRIRWGIDTERFAPPTDAERAAARRQLGLGPDQVVSFWTGFIQQTTEDDLRAAAQTANRVLDADGSKYVFLFCFKPEHFKESFRSFERPGLRVFGSADAFHAARSSADLFLSPIQDARSTAAPPLAWLETLAMGIPILTTDIPGSEEAVVDGVSGMRVASPEAAGDRLREMAGDDAMRRRLREGARAIAVERYSVDRALDEYLDLWKGLANGRGRTAAMPKSLKRSKASYGQ